MFQKLYKLQTHFSTKFSKLTTLISVIVMYALNSTRNDNLNFQNLL